MIYKIVFIALILSGSFRSNAQNLEVIASAGNDTTLSDKKVSWTIGEAITGIGYNDTNFFTQGFHQSNLQIWLFEEPKLAEIKCSVYPNPAYNFFFIKSSDLMEGMQIRIHDLKGKIIYQSRFLNSPMRMNVSAYPPGTYILTVLNNNEKTYTYKILKN